MNGAEIKTIFFKDDGVIPGNPNLPVILYLGSLKDEPEETEAVFNRNGWLNSWTNGVFDYHHYHSNAHEVLGVIRGSAVLQLGGEHGQKFELAAGDVAVLPAGTGHKRCSASKDFRVVGAYPDGMDYNLCTGKPGERPKVLEDIARVPLPNTDPLYGAAGPLLSAWKPQQQTGDHV